MCRREVDIFLYDSHACRKMHHKKRHRRKSQLAIIHIVERKPIEHLHLGTTSEPTPQFGLGRPKPDLRNPHAFLSNSLPVNYLRVTDTA